MTRGEYLWPVILIQPHDTARGGREKLVFDDLRPNSEKLSSGRQVTRRLFAVVVEIWRPVQSNPCRRREREATYCNSTVLSGMDSTF